MAKKLPKGIRENKGAYEARAIVNGVKIYLYGKDLEQLIFEFEVAKEQARNSNGYNSNTITLNEWFEEWFTNVKAKKIKETSINPMKNSYKRTFGFYIGNMKLKDIKPMDVQKALNAMEQKGMSSGGMRDTLGRLRECMQFAVGNQLIPVNPCMIVEVPWTFKMTKEETALTREEQNIFLNEVEESWYKELFYFMCLTGVRVGELGGLQWSDISFEKKTINIRRSLSCAYYEGEKTETLVTPKTTSSIRQIPFIGEMEEILLAQKEKQERLKKQLGKRWRGKKEHGNLVFVTTMGSACSRYIVDKEVKRIVKRIREKEALAAMEEERIPSLFRDFHPHTLRHTFATRCFENGMDPKVVQKLMGHSSITITMNIYTHVLDNKMDEEIKKFGMARTETIREREKYSIDTEIISAHNYW